MSATAAMDPLQTFELQTQDLIHQNVMNSLTAVHATGGDVLWMNPPSSVALQMNFVQDFLSNIATCWLWVDACQF